MGRAEDLFERLEKDGEAAIDMFIKERKTEELFLDFKRASTAAERLSDDDRRNYSKALAGFANSEGGVIVWGVDARLREETGDVAQSKIPVPSVTRFVSFLEAETSGATDPPVPHVRNVPIARDDGTGFALTYVRRSPQAPHRSLRDEHYYMRVGSSFGRVSHRVLRGMFGHPDPPMVIHTFSVGRRLTRVPASGDLQAVHIDVGIQLCNLGPGIARDVFLNLVFGQSASDGSQLAFTATQPLPGWSGNFMFGHRAHLVMDDNAKLAPDAMVQPGVITFALKPPFDEDLFVELVYGHGTSPSSRVVLRLPAEKLTGHFAALRAGLLFEADFMGHFAQMLSPPTIL